MMTRIPDPSDFASRHDDTKNDEIATETGQIHLYAKPRILSESSLLVGTWLIGLHPLHERRLSHKQGSFW
jgi:hypothetical protein